jgi:hypothetical protein
LDVTLPENQTLLGTDPGELASEWKLLTDPPTQRLGLTAYETGRFSETPSFTSPMVVSEFRFNEIPR